MFTTARVLLVVALLLVPLHLRAAGDPPVTPGAIPAVGWVLDLLRETSGKKILSGQQERIDWFGLDNEANVDFVTRATGLTPAVRGFDFMFYTHSADGRAGQRAAERAIHWARRGGLVQFCIHWFVDTGSAPGNPKFYTSETSFDIRRALEPGTPENAEFMREMDLIAGELAKLRDAGVPVIWRPFHECSGGWFWWGAKGPEPFKQAYRLMFDRYTRVHGLTNLIWCYNPTESIGALEAWYPGDDVVDLIGLDIYPSAGTHPHYPEVFRRFRDFTQGRKPVTLTENGPIPDLDAMFADGTGWPSFCTWNGFESDPAQNSTAFLQRVYRDPRTITLETMPDVYRQRSRPPSIALAPRSLTVTPGTTASLGVVANGSGTLRFQWLRNGQPLAGGTEATLTLPRVAAADAGTYAVRIANDFGSVESSAATLALGTNPTPPGPPQLANLSTRAALGTRGDLLIAGFVIQGEGVKRVLIRAIGPTLSAFAVPSPLPDPAMTLVDESGRALAESDDWSPADASLPAAFAATGAFALPTGSRDAALIASLPPGSYTVLVRSADAVSGGTVLAEIYDLAPTASARLVNLSTRGAASTSQPLIAGFVSRAAAPRAWLIRAAGPALTRFGVEGALPDPQLTVTSPTGEWIAANSGWSRDPLGAAVTAQRAAQAGAFPFVADARDAAVVVDRAPGGTTAIIGAASTARGTVLAEIYELP